VLKGTGNALPHDPIASQNVRTCAPWAKADDAIAPKRTPERADESGVRTKKLAANDAAERSVRRRSSLLNACQDRPLVLLFCYSSIPTGILRASPLPCMCECPKVLHMACTSSRRRLCTSMIGGRQVALVVSSARSAGGRWQGYSDAVI
jgi:hypothetical protein